MTKDNQTYKTYVQILQEELVLAMGCTEPISLAYTAARARDTLGAVPDKIKVSVSGNIIKNVKSVIVPNTGGLHGIQAAVAAGVIFGQAEKELEALSEATPAQQAELRTYLKTAKITVQAIQSEALLDIAVTAYKNGDYATVRVAGTHANVVYIAKNGNVLLDKGRQAAPAVGEKADRKSLNIADIFDFAQSVELEDARALISRQIQCNTRISEEGLSGAYGAQIGRVLLSVYGAENVARRASAKAAAGSDARMSGCELPVVINSGSGNQGITVCVPVVEYARELGAGEEQMYRALVLSNLTAVHLKSGIGVLSAYCGAVSAGVACGAGIAYLHKGDLRIIAHTIVNALAIASGIICDGAKPSCAAKIATAVDAGILGYHMIANGSQFRGEDGIIKKGVEETIKSVSRLGKEGMRETDRVILDIMTAARIPSAQS